MIVTLEEAKARLKVEGNDEDAYLESLLMAAEAVAVEICHVPLPDPPPEPARLAALLFVGHFYMNRENADPRAYEAMMTAFKYLLSPYREQTF